MTARIPLALLLLVVASADASAQRAGDLVDFEGQACRINRSLDRLIVMTASGVRARVAVESPSLFTYGYEQYDPADLRPGNWVRVDGRLNLDGAVEANSVRVRPDVVGAIWDAVSSAKSNKLVGRFSVREAKTEFFSLRLPGMNYVRVDAKAAYGGRGRVRVSSLKSGDLLEVRGEWMKDGLFRASYIDIQTDYEPTSCKAKLSADEAAAEQEFLGR